MDATFDYVDASNGFEVTFDEGSANLLLLGGLAPRFQLQSLLYAPPGHASYVDYSDTTTIGSSFGISSSFTGSSGFSFKFGIGVNKRCGAGSNGGKQICGTGNLSGTGGSGFTQEEDSSSTTAVSQEQGFEIKISGPQPNQCLGQTDTQMDDRGLDHDYDAFLVWLNPVIDLAGQPASSGGALYWTGYSFDPLDPSKNIDFVSISPGQLKDADFPADLNATGSCYYQPGLYQELQRGWDTSGVPGGPALASADYQAILSAEPWVNDPHATSTPLDTNRFTGPLNSIVLQYETNQVATGYSACYNSSFAASVGEKITSSTKSGWSFGFSFFDGLISGDLSDASTATPQSGWSGTDTQKVGQCATISITGPPAGSGYAGPTEFNVYQDNIYGTFMIWPVQP